VRQLSISVGTFRRLATASVAAYALLVVTGGAVRLTGSGLGCPDWPTCSGHLVTTALSYNRAIEYGNRLVTVAVTVLSIAVFLAALALRPRRRDLRALSGGLVIGLVAQIILGGLVVLFQLNPYLVALHFVLTLAVLGDALVLRYRTIAGTPGAPLIGRDLRWCATIALGALCVLLTIGTVVTGSGPHPGSGAHVKRFGIAFRDIAELHSSVALFVVGLVLALVFGLRQTGAPPALQRRARTLFELLVVQAGLGYTQYALHDQPLVVELHLAGATAIWLVAVSFVLDLRAPKPVSPPQASVAEPLRALVS
jgi:heme a synthase